MKLRVAMLAVTAAAALAGLGPAPAQAEVWYPWCATYSGGREGIGATVCSFSTRAQCMATVTGVQGFCGENPEPPPVPARTQLRRRR